MKKFIYLILALTLLFYFWQNYSLNGIDKKLYLQSASSNAVVVQGKGVYNKVKGECVTVTEKDACKILREYNAKIVKVEKVEGVVSYYAYSDKLPYQITLFGERVNLHIAIGESQTKIGTPIIFDSF